MIKIGLSVGKAQQTKSIFPPIIITLFTGIVHCHLSLQFGRLRYSLLGRNKRFPLGQGWERFRFLPLRKNIGV
jgi:hypothetical protein